MLRDPTGCSGNIQIALTGPVSGQSNAAKAALNPASQWYLGKDVMEDNGRLCLTTDPNEAVRVTWVRQHVLKLTVSLHLPRAYGLLTEHKIR